MVLHNRRSSKLLGYRSGGGAFVDSLATLFGICVVLSLCYKAYEDYYLPHHLTASIRSCSEKADASVAALLPTNLTQSIDVLRREQETMVRCMRGAGYAGDAVAARQHFIEFLRAKGFQVMNDDSEYEGSLKFVRSLQRHPDGNTYWKRQ